MNLDSLYSKIFTEINPEMTKKFLLDTEGKIILMEMMLFSVYLETLIINSQYQSATLISHGIAQDYFFLIK